MKLFGVKFLEVRIKLLGFSCFTAKCLTRSLWPASVKFLGGSSVLVTACYFKKIMWPFGLVILWWVLFIDLIQGPYKSIEKSFRPYVTSDNTQDVNTKFLEGKGKCFTLPLQPALHGLTGNQVHNTLQQRGPYVWKGQRNIKSYP